MKLSFSVLKRTKRDEIEKAEMFYSIKTLPWNVKSFCVFMLHELLRFSAPPTTRTVIFQFLLFSFFLPLKCLYHFDPFWWYNFYSYSFWTQERRRMKLNEMNRCWYRTKDFTFFSSVSVVVDLSEEKKVRMKIINEGGWKIHEE